VLGQKVTLPINNTALTLESTILLLTLTEHEVLCLMEMHRFKVCFVKKKILAESVCLSSDLACLTNLKSLFFHELVLSV